MKTAFVALLFSALSLSALGGGKAAELVKGFEGFRPAVYKCSAGKPTIGYGCTSPEVVARGRITEREAAALVSAKCDEIAAKVRREFSLTPNEEAAVVSFGKSFELRNWHVRPPMKTGSGSAPMSSQKTKYS